MVSTKNFISHSSKQIFHSNSKMGQATNAIVIFCAQLLIQLTTLIHTFDSYAIS